MCSWSARFENGRGRPSLPGAIRPAPKAASHTNGADYESDAAEDRRASGGHGILWRSPFHPTASPLSTRRLGRFQPIGFLRSIAPAAVERGVAQGSWSSPHREVHIVPQLEL